MGHVFASRRSGRTVLLAALLGGAAPQAFAASFHDTSGIDTSSKTLNADEMGIVDFGATLKTSGIGVTLAGTNVVLKNAGTIQSTGKRAIDTSFSNGNYNIDVENSGTITASTADAFRINADTGTGDVIVLNSGTISATGTGSVNGQALDFANINKGLGTITITNTATGVVTAADADAIRPGTNTTLNNYGVITAFAPPGSTGNDAIDFQDKGTGTVNNYASGIITGARDGITGDLGVTIYNEGKIIGLDGSGLNFDTAGNTTMTVTNKGTITGNAVSGDGDGIDVDGLVTINNYGTINAKGTFAGETNEALALGGGTINNYAGGVIDSVQRAITIDNSNLGNAFGAVSIYNEGTITGEDGEAIKITSLFDNTLTNKGTINGSIVMGSGNDTVNLYTGSTTGAIDGGAGSDTIHLQGTGTGTLTTVSNIETLDVDSGTWTVNGTQNFSGGVAVAQGATAVITGTLNGDMTNYGTVSVQNTSVTFNGAFNNNGAYSSNLATQSFANLTIGQTGYLMGAANDTFKVAGNLMNNSTGIYWNTQTAVLDFVGVDGTNHTFGVVGADNGMTLEGNQFRWGALDIDLGNSLSIVNDAAGDQAVYVTSLVGAIISGDHIANIEGFAGLTIYYNPWDAANAYLHGLNYFLEDGGVLIANVPEPASIALLLTGLGVAGFRFRRKKAQAR
jgi:hypothetical protein